MRPATLAPLVSSCALNDIRLVVVILFSLYFPLVAASKLVQTDFPLSVPLPFGDLMSSESRDCKQAIGQMFCLSHSVQANQIHSTQKSFMSFSAVLCCTYAEVTSEITVRSCLCHH